MKAIEYYNKLKASKTKEEFENELNNCLVSLIQDANKLIKIRRATSDNAVRKCILEVNDKWKAIVNLRENDKNIDKDSPMYAVYLVKDGFQAAYVMQNPKRRWMFDLEQHKRNVKQEQMQYDIKQLKQEGFDIVNATLILFGFTPYTKIQDCTISDLRKLVLQGYMTLSSIFGSNAAENTKGLWMRIIADYIFRLNFWISIDKIDMEVVDMSIDEIRRYAMDKYNVSCN